MKIRKGFVSNSSSASYYVTIKDTRSAVFHELKRECHWPWFDNERLANHIRTYINARERTLLRLEQGQELFLLETKEEVREDIKRAEKELEMIDINSIKISDDHVRIALKYNHIELKELEDRTLLEHTTIMHNNYVEGMADMLKDIVLYYSFEQPHKIDLRIEHYNNR